MATTQIKKLPTRVFVERVGSTKLRLIAGHDDQLVQHVGTSTSVKPNISISVVAYHDHDEHELLVLVVCPVLPKERKLLRKLFGRKAIDGLICRDGSMRTIPFTGFPIRRRRQRQLYQHSARILSAV